MRAALRILGSGVPLRCGVGGSLVSPGCKSNASGLLKRWVVVICVLSCISLSRRRPSPRSLQIVQMPLPRLRSGDNKIRRVGRNLFGFPSNVILIIRQFGLIVAQFRHIASSSASPRLRTTRCDSSKGAQVEEPDPHYPRSSFIRVF